MLPKKKALQQKSITLSTLKMIFFQFGIPIGILLYSKVVFNLEARFLALRLVKLLRIKIRQV